MTRPPPDDGVAAFLGEVRAAMDRRIAGVPRGGDFMDVVARAHQLDGSTVPEGMVDEATQLAPVVDIRAAGESRGSAEAELDAFVGEARDALEARISRRRLARVPPMRAMPERSRAGWAIVFGLAAAVGLGWLAVDVAPWLAPAADDPVPDQAVQVEAGAETPAGGEARLRSPAPARAPAADPEPPPPEEVEVIEPPRPTTKRARPSRRDREAQLRDLLERAQLQWRTGNVAEAETLLRKVVKLGGRSRYVESAYADLFSITRNRHDASGRRKTWRAYLARFPRGQFADDARAGLCRTASTDDRVSCWDSYLADFPSGSYRHEASKARGG